MIDPDIISDEQKQVARFAKAMGHPIRMYILQLLTKQSCCYSGDLSEILHHCQINAFTTFKRIERCRFNSRRN